MGERSEDVREVKKGEERREGGRREGGEERTL